MKAVLIIDDAERFRARLCRAFELRGWDAFGAADGAAARTIAVEVGPDLALVDLKLASESGLDVVRQLRNLNASFSIIMLTGSGDLATTIEAIKQGADQYLTSWLTWSRFCQHLKLFRIALERTRLLVTVHALARAEWELHA